MSYRSPKYSRRSEHRSNRRKEVADLLFGRIPKINNLLTSVATKALVTLGIESLFVS